MFLAHHGLNWIWTRMLGVGRYRPYCILQIVLNGLLLCTMVGAMASGIVLSRHMFVSLAISGGQGWARILHMLCVYWCFTLMSLHAGLHWGMILGMIRRLGKREKASPLQTTILRVAGVIVAIYGVYAFGKRELPSYLFLKSHFVFFDYQEPLIRFFLDYLAIMGLFIFCGHLLSKKSSRQV